MTPITRTRDDGFRFRACDCSEVRRQNLERLNQIRRRGVFRCFGAIWWLALEAGVARCRAELGRETRHNTLVSLNPTGVTPGWRFPLWLDSWKRIEELHTEQLQEPPLVRVSRLALDCCPSDATRAACPGAPLGFRLLVDVHFLAQSQR
jgi:hypothetical protein